jgi:cell division protein YceG involved in septum cleavage
MRTVLMILVIFLLIATTTALKQVTVIDDGYMAAKESYKRVNVPGETYWQEIAPSFENAELINNTPNIIVDQNHAGYLVFDIKP